MNIGILGAGRIGETTAELFTKAGHSVAISNSKGPASLTSLVEKIGSNARAVTAEEAVKFGDIVLIAVPWTRRHELPDAQLFENKLRSTQRIPMGRMALKTLAIAHPAN